MREEEQSFVCCLYQGNKQHHKVHTAFIKGEERKHIEVIYLLFLIKGRDFSSSISPVLRSFPSQCVEF